MIRIRSSLQQLNLRQHLKLFAFLVEVDEIVARRVGNGSVNHCEVGEERSEIGNRAVTNEHVLLLEDFLQVAIILADSVSELMKMRGNL